MRQTIKGIVFVPVVYMPGTAGTPAQYHEDSSDWQSPFGWQLSENEYHSLEHTFIDPPVPLDDVEVRVEAYADLDAANEKADVYLNDNLIDPVFVDPQSSYDCTGLSEDTLTIPKAIWEALVGAGSAAFRITPTDYVDYAPMECYPNYGTARVHIRFKITEAIPPILGKGPSFTRYRSYKQHYDGNGNYGYLWATLRWDPIRKHHVWDIVCQPTGKHSYGGVARSPTEATDEAPGNNSFVVHAGHYYRPRLVRLTSSGDCYQI